MTMRSEKAADRRHERMLLVLRGIRDGKHNAIIARETGVHEKTVSATSAAACRLGFVRANYERVLGRRVCGYTLTADGREFLESEE